MKLYGFNSDRTLNPATGLLLQACTATLPGERRAHAAAWEKLVNMDGLEYSAMRLVPLFLHKNQQDGITTIHDKRLKVIYKYWWLKTQHIFNQLKGVHAALLAAGIQPVVIKGASLMGYYSLPELRPMADFDLVIPPGDIDKALAVLKAAGYTCNSTKERLLQQHRKLTLSFSHSIECVHTATGTHLDLHWKIGSLCSQQFTQDMLAHLQPYNSLPGGLKPAPEYELFLTIIHAVTSWQADNLNWIIDIDVLNSLFDKSYWQKARMIAIREKKEGLFDYGCFVLQQYGIYAPPVSSNRQVRVPFYFRNYDTRQWGSLRLYRVKITNVALTIGYLFPHSGMAAKCVQAVKRTWYKYLERSGMKSDEA